jgi:NADH-quinone oxidoreductase subunit L
MDQNLNLNLWLIPLLPFAGFLINGLFGRKLSKMLINAIAVGSVVLSFLWVLRVVMALQGAEEAHIENYFTWIQSGAFKVAMEFSVDRLTEVMLLIVTGIGSLIHIYATGYMAHEGGYYRFFAYLNLFMAFMLTLVLGANYLVLFVGWEGVGLCSYLLVGFYFTEKFATDAGNKAFIVNRIGDFSFSLAIFLMVVNFGTLNFHDVFAAAPGKPVSTLTAIALLLLGGACGKSAQFPLYVWLPDAMAGPTPVSALIHAATMVTAGVYMVGRSHVIFAHSPTAMAVVAFIGLFTAVFAASIGLAQNDIKKVFAYSTVSQLGYMFLGEGVGAFSAGIWHVVTHAFFKALLFLGAGSVIHACSGEQDMRHMGGLKNKIPITFWTLVCAALAISGVPFTSGFFSKDAILSAAYQVSPWYYWIGTITAGMTAFYVWRAIFMTFFGEYRGHHADHIHESPISMTGPLAVLAFLSLAGGLLFKIPSFLEPLFGAEGAEDMTLVAISSAAGLVGIGIAYWMYVVSPGIPDAIVGRFQGLYTLILNKYYVDEIYDATVVDPLIGGSSAVLWRIVDAGVIDGAVNGVGTQSRGMGMILRMLQSGSIRNYATWVVFGSVLLVAAIAAGVTGGIR